MDSQDYYLIYIFLLITLTAYISVSIFNGNFEETGRFLKKSFTGTDKEYKLFDVSSLKVGRKCPCDEPGEETPGCGGCNPFLRSRDPPKFVKNYIGIYDGSPVCIEPSLVKINSKGFRDKEYSIEKPKNTTRIVALGDSYTFGIGINLSDTWHQRLENKLNEVKAGNYEFLNLGVPGINAQKKVNFLKRKGLKFNPDMVFLQYHSKDLRNFTEQERLVDKMINETVKRYANKHGLDPKEVRGEEIMKKLTTKGANRAQVKYFKRIENKPYKKTWHRLVGRPLEELRNLSVKHGFDVFIFVYPPNRERDIPSLKSFCKKYDNFKYLPVYSEWRDWERKYGRSRLIINKIDTHPSEFSNKLVANYFYKKWIGSNKLNFNESKN